MPFDKTLGTLAKETGISIPTLRLYADTELIPCIRDSVGRRLFPDSAIEIALRVRKERMSGRKVA